MRVHAARDSADLGPQRLPRQSSYRACPEEKIASWLHSRRGRQGGRHRWVVGVGRARLHLDWQVNRSPGWTVGRTHAGQNEEANPTRSPPLPVYPGTVLRIDSDGGVHYPSSAAATPPR
jgi:hypothetical protein